MKISNLRLIKSVIIELLNNIRSDDSSVYMTRLGQYDSTSLLIVQIILSQILQNS